MVKITTCVSIIFFLLNIPKDSHHKTFIESHSSWHHNCFYREFDEESVKRSKALCKDVCALIYRMGFESISQENF